MSDYLLESKLFSYSGGLPIHYQVTGYGPTYLVFLHGFASAHSTWHELAGYFPADRFTLHFVDLKGFGLSAKPRDGAYAVEDQAAMVQTLIRYLGVRSVVLVGHSLGGAVALRLCLQEMDDDCGFTVEKLILIDCAAYPQRLPKFFRRLRTPLLGPLLIRLIPVRKMVRMTLAKVFYDPQAISRGMEERYARYFRGSNIPYALRATVKCIDPSSYVCIGERYRSLSVPTLIIWGEHDRIIKLKYGYRLHDDLADSRLKVLKKCGHNPHEERPAETFAAICAFLSPPDPATPQES